MKRFAIRMAILPILVAMTSLAWAVPEETKISELAPGVYFRKAQTSPVFTGCNQGWVIFRDYVLIIDANFPGQADEVIASIRKCTDKPIRFVFDTHYHGDHADGNMQYAKIGATIIAQERSQQLFQTKGKAGFDRSKVSREKEYGQLSYELPSLYFTHKLIFDDGTQRVELVFFGHGHTAGDAVAWLPKHGILFTGDACVNGAFNYTGDSNTESWTAALGAMQELGVKTLCPGHGEFGGPEVLNNQRRYLGELRGTVGKMVAEGKSLDAIKKDISLPFFKEWTGVDITTRDENIEHVYKELTAPKLSLKEAAAFRAWEKLPGQEGYVKSQVWAALGETPADYRWDALADIYLAAGSARRKEIRDHFTGQQTELTAMWQYVRRAAARFSESKNLPTLRRGLAIAAIEGARFNYLDTIDSLVLLRYAAERHGVNSQAFFVQIRDWVAPENLPLFERVRALPKDQMIATVQALRPVGESSAFELFHGLDAR